MKSTAFLFIILVSALNVGLNILVRKSANQELSFLKNIFSYSFGLSFLIGLLSVLCMLQVYRSQVNIAQGILLMGIFSIIGGSLASVVFLKQKLLGIEWILLIILSVLLVFRYAKTL